MRLSFLARFLSCTFRSLAAQAYCTSFCSFRAPVRASNSAICAKWGALQKLGHVKEPTPKPVRTKLRRGLTCN